MSRWARILKSYQKIKLVDRCLIIFMLVLMAQSTFNLFANELNSQETNTIDIMVRTTSAAIFGYFLSVNFIKKPSRKSAVSPAPAASAPQLTLPDAPMTTSLIGFSADTPPQMSVGSAAGAYDELREEAETGQQQIIIATIIGVFALCVLIFVRNCSPVTAAMLGTISQMRDFVSGCVGFLLGSPGVDNP